MAVAHDGFIKRRARKGKREQHLAALPLLDDVRIKGAQLANRAFGGLPEADALADIHLLRRPHEGPPTVLALALVQGRLNARRDLAARAKAIEAGGDHLGVIDNKHIASTQE